MTRSAIEAMLRAMPGVADCAVVNVPGVGQGVVLLATVQVSDGTLTTEQVQGWLRERVAESDVPQRVVFYAVLPPAMPTEHEATSAPAPLDGQQRGAWNEK